MHASVSRKLIVKGLGSVLEPAGFAYRKSDEEFVRTFVGGHHTVSVGFWSYPPSHVFSLTPGVRIDAIEELYHDIAALPDEYRRRTSSMPVQLWKLAGLEKPARDVPLPGWGAPFYYTVTSETEIAEAVNTVESVLRDLVLPFFERCQGVESVNRGINHDGLDTSNARILHGPVAAHLARDPAYAAILSRYQKEMETWQANDRETFERAVRYLANHPV